jgi:hypothetical protein
LHPAVLGEQLFEALVGDVVTEVADVESRSHCTDSLQRTNRPAADFPDRMKGINVVIHQAGEASQGRGSKEMPDPRVPVAAGAKGGA